VDGYLAVAQRLGQHPGGCYNFGAGHATSILDVAVMVSEAFDGVRREPVFSGPRRERALVKRLDIGRASRELSWHPRTQLSEGLMATVEYARRWPAT